MPDVWKQQRTFLSTHPSTSTRDPAPMLRIVWDWKRHLSVFNSTSYSSIMWGQARGECQTSTSRHGGGWNDGLCHTPEEKQQFETAGGQSLYINIKYSSLAPGTRKQEQNYVQLVSKAWGECAWLGGSLHPLISSVSLLPQEAAEIYPCPYAAVWRSLYCFHGYAIHRCVRDSLASSNALWNAVQLLPGIVSVKLQGKIMRILVGRGGNFECRAVFGTEAVFTIHQISFTRWFDGILASSMFYISKTQCAKARCVQQKKLFHWKITCLTK